MGKCGKRDVLVLIHDPFPKSGFHSGTHGPRVFIASENNQVSVGIFVCCPMALARHAAWTPAVTAIWHC